MVFCQECGTKVKEGGHFCHNCGVKSSQNGLSQRNDVNKQSLTFEEFKKRKETDRRSKFKSAKLKQQKKVPDSMVKVQVGLVTCNEDSRHLKKVKGRTIPVLINNQSDANTLLNTAVEKHARHFKQFNKFLDYVVLYSDMSLVHYLPGTSTPFTLEKYKSDLLKPYSKLYFWLCVKDEFENANCESSDSDDQGLPPMLPVDCSSTSTATAAGTSMVSTLSLSQPSTSSAPSCPLGRCSSSATTTPPAASYHQCPTCYELFPQEEIEYHADLCAESWVDPIGDLDQAEETQSEEEMEFSTGNPKDTSEVKLDVIKDKVAHLKQSCVCLLTNRVLIRRRLIFHDYLDARKKKWFKPKALLKITFVGEPAVDDGGPKREFFTEVFSHIRRTLFSDDGVPHADMRALANEEFKATGELMASSLIQGGPAPSFLSVDVYNYIIDGISSVQSERWTALIPDDSLRQSIEKIAACSTDEQLRSLLCEDSILDILQMIGYRGVTSKETLSSATEIQRSIVISGMAKTLATMDQIAAGFASFGALNYIRSNKDVMQPLFTLGGAKHFQPTPELFLEGLKVEFGAEGSNKKASEIDVYKNFCDFVQDLGTTEGGLAKLYKFVTGSDSFTPLGLERLITVHFTHCCVQGCKCRPTASTCDPSITLPIHYKEMAAFEEVMSSALEEALGFGLV